MTFVNTNPETGVRYGIVSLNSLAEWVFDEFFYNGTNVSYEAALKEWIAEGNDPEVDEFDYEGDEDMYELETEGMKLGMSTLGGAYNVWVYDSPVFNNAVALCSPCIPNAGNLDTEGIYSCYTLPTAWFAEKGRA
jgi:hypothetical protein